MLHTIELINFMSHANTTITFKKGVFSIIGENGQGKSALLEAIPYVFYGKTRTPAVGDLIREGCNEMKVRVVFSIGNNKNIQITRGVKTNGNGISELIINKKIEASGSDVTPYVEKLLGLSGDTFLLTTFFGLRASDSILNVKPSERLETLQQLAGASIYKVFHKDVQKRQALVSSSTQNIKGQLEALQLSEATPKGTLKQLHSDLTKEELKLDSLRIKQAHLMQASERWQSLLVEKAKLETVIKNSRDKLEHYQNDMGDIAKMSRSIANTIQTRADKIKAALSKIGSLKETSQQTEYDNTVRELSKIIVEANLRRAACELPGKPKCPLCNSSITPSRILSWKEELVKLDEEVKQLTRETSTMAEALKRVDFLSNEIKTLKQKTELDRSTLSEMNNRLDLLKAHYRKVQGEISQTQSRLKAIAEDLAPSTQMIKDAAKTRDEIEKAVSVVSSLQEQIIQQKKQIAIEEAQHAQITNLKTELQNKQKEVVALTILNDLFSRYGIPMQLLNTLQVRLSMEATAVYTEFDSGSILVNEIEERGHPGIDIVLQRPNGVIRSYESLSEGQRAIVYFSIRLALARILAETHSNVPDFLILDELTGHLSETVRESLTSMIMRVLQKEYSQIIMTSHTPLRDIFTNTISVKLENDMSVVSIT